MIVECTGCHTKYKIPDERVPASGLDVRCPKCKVVFAVRRKPEDEGGSLAERLFGKEVLERPLGGQMTTPPSEDREEGERDTSAGTEEPGTAEEGASESPSAQVGEQERREGSGSWVERLRREPKAEEPEGPERGATQDVAEAEEPAAPQEDRTLEEHEPEVPEAAFAGEGEEPGAAGFPLGAEEEDPRTLARALVSDILFYNRKERDEGLAEDKILAYLGKEIARSWEIYKERIGIEKAIETDHFREAVNEILADGKKIL